MRRPALSALSALTLLAASLAACSRCDSEGEGPNVVVLVVDTLRADRLPFYGHDVDTAPFLSDLARRGVVFERAWSTSSWTAPATASIFTSLYPFQHGVEQGIKLVRDAQQGDPTIELKKIPGRVETLPELARGLGYRTFGIADNPNICDEEGFESGFCRFAGYGYEGADKVNQTLAKWVDEIRGEGKWFAYLHYMDPHFPYRTRGPWFQRPPGKEPVPGDAREAHRPWYLARYDSEIGFVDQKIREAFEMLGVDDDTVVIFVADHGEELLQRSDNLQHDFKLYSELTHVPLVVYHPGAERARLRVTQNVSIVDVLPTLREILGAAASDQDAGESLVPYYSEPAERAGGRPIFSMRRRLGVLGGEELLAVVQDDEKLVRYRDPKKDEQYLELFDLREDWAELENLAAASDERVAALLQLWEEFQARAQVFDAEESRMHLTEDEARNIEDLGY